MPQRVEAIKGAPQGDTASAKAAAKATLDVLKRAKKQRQPWLQIWSEAYDYVLPMRERFLGGTPGERRTNLIFDETAVVGLPRFASRLVAGTFPEHARAFSLRPGKFFPGNPNARGVQKDLDEIAELMHESMRTSNFSAELHEAYQDLGLGTLNMTIDPGPFTGDIVTAAVPLTHVMLLNGHDDRPAAWVTESKHTLRAIDKLWPRANIPVAIRRKFQDDTELSVVTATVDRSTPSELFAWDLSVVLLTEEIEIFKEEYRGIGANRWLTSRWSKQASEAYGRGPVLLALPAIKTCNLVVELILENAQMAIGGIWTYDDDGVFNPDNIVIEPGVFVPRAAGSNIDQLLSGARFDVAQLVLEEMRKNIRKALFIDELEREGKTPPSAFEAAELRADAAMNMGSVTSRQVKEFHIPLVQRLAHILTKQGAIEIPRIDGKQLTLVPEAPLLRAQKHQDLADFLGYQGDLRGIFGDQAAMALTDPVEAAIYLAGLRGVPARLIPTKAKVEATLDKARQFVEQNPEATEALSNVRS